MNAYNTSIDITKGNLALFFSGPYCGTCKMIKPGIEKAAASCTDKVSVLEADTSLPDVLKLAQVYGVSMLPTVIVLKDGQQVAKLTGAGQVSIPNILKALA